jgi:hypothetical protein
MMSSLASVCVLLGVAASAPTTPAWQSDYGKALAETRADERPLLVVIDKPADGDEALSAELLKDSKALAAYELCHVDASTEYGQAVAEVFRAREFPYVAIIDKTGTRVLNRHVGNMSAETWSEKLARYELGTAPQKVTAMKPVASGQTVGGATVESAPGASYPSYDSFPVYSSPRSNCPSCQRGY